VASWPGAVLQLKTSRGIYAQETCVITPKRAVAGGAASEARPAGPQEAIPTAAGSREKPGVSGLDTDARMRSLFWCEPWIKRDRSGPHECPGSQGSGAEDFGLLGDSPLCSPHRENLDSYHRLGEREFSHKHGIELKEIVLRLQSQFWLREPSENGGMARAA